MRKASDPDIGKRAAAEIRRRAYEEDTTFAAQRDALRIHSSEFCRWECGVMKPGALALAAMARAGYDVHYILTGERRTPCP